MFHRLWFRSLAYLLLHAKHDYEKANGRPNIIIIIIIIRQ
jgi:hypothetical protein